jgi:hypothetical protein
MDYKAKLAGRITMDDIHKVCLSLQGNDKNKGKLYKLLFDEDDKLSINTAWIFTHLNRHENKWLYGRQDELIDEVIVCRNPSKRRLLLALIFRQPLPASPRVDFLNFCMNRMISKEELPGVQSLCMKLAYEQCRFIPELIRELRVMLDIMDPNALQVSLHTVRKHVLKAIQTGKSLQKY